MDCLVTCPDFQSFSGRCNEIISPNEPEIISPFVKATFTSGEVITVGNDSYNGTNGTKSSAVIKSFEYGSSTGHKCYLQIHDVEGGAFSVFIKKILRKTVDISSSGLNLKIQYGWVYSSCNAPSNGILNGVNNQEPPTVYFVPQNIQINMSAGKLLFEVEGTELFAIGEEFRCNKVFGKDGSEIHLKDAIRELLKDPDTKPVIENVQFLQPKTDGSGFEELIFEGDNEGVTHNGPKGVYSACNLTKKAAISQWLRMAKARSSNEKGLILKWDGVTKGGGVIILEDTKPKCGDSFGSNCLGTYIVNGGNCSPVIEFNPKINWKWQYAAASGAIISKNQANFLAMPGRPECIDKSKPGTGVAVTTPTTSNDEIAAGSDATKSKQETSVATQYANVMYGEEISANLVIQGDPRSEYSSSYLSDLYTIGIVVINPFNLFTSTYPDSDKPNLANNCPVWLAKPACNSTFTSPYWRIRGINHYITEGKYITTLNVYLVVGAVEEKIDSL